MFPRTSQWSARITLALVAVLALACPRRDDGFQDVLQPDGAAVDGAGDSSFDVMDAGSSDVNDVSLHDRADDVPDMRPRMDIVIPGMPAITNAPSRFGGPEDSTRAPEIVYPSPGTILPPNLTGFEVHFRPGTGNDLFEVSFGGDSAVVRIYTRCASVGGGCALTIDDPTYRAVVAAARPGRDLTVRVRGTSDAAGGRFGASPEQALGMADMDVRGGIYYWAASGTINRYEFGLPGAAAEVFLRGDLINCVGCHVLSRNGQRITAGRFIPAPAPTQIYDVVTRMTTSPSFGMNFGSFSPDASRLIASDGNYLTLLDGATGAGVTGLAASTIGTHPDWSPDGTRVVFARPRMIIPFAGNPGHNAPADLLLMAYSAGTFAAPTPIVLAASENNYYPAFSPDNNWLLWNRSSGQSYDAPDAQLWAMPLDRTRPPLRLTSADGGDALNNSWPKWAPIVGTYGGETLYWFTFSSRRDYGLRIQNSGRPRASQTAQLWMAAFRPGRPVDPSAAAFWLPFQDRTVGNHIAQWTTEVRRRTCRTDPDCGPDEQCVTLTAGGVCVGRR